MEKQHGSNKMKRKEKFKTLSRRERKVRLDNVIMPHKTVAVALSCQFLVDLS